MARPIVIVGGGGHARVVIDALRCSGEYEPAAVVDSALEPGDEVDGVVVRGGDELLPVLAGEGVAAAAIAVGSIGDAAARRRLHGLAAQHGFALPAIVHPRATVATTARVEDGCFVAAGAVVGPGARLGIGTIVNSNAVVDHDCALGEFVHVAPGAALSGAVTVGDDAHVGTGAAVVQQIKIGAGAIVGAGAVVIKDVPANTVAVGVPARDDKR